MDMLTFLLDLKAIGAIPWSRERNALPSNSDVRRGIEGGAVLVNGERVTLRQEMGEVDSLVFFPHGRNRTTLR